MQHTDKNFGEEPFVSFHTIDQQANNPALKKAKKKVVKKKAKKKSAKKKAKKVNSKVLIGLKQKPKRPTPKKLTRSKLFRNLPKEFTLEYLLKKFNVTDAKDINIKTGAEYGGAYAENCRVIAQVPETDDQFSKRVAKYEKELAKWEEWSHKNKDLIQKEIKRRKEEVKKKKEKELSKLDSFLD